MSDDLHASSVLKMLRLTRGDSERGEAGVLIDCDTEYRKCGICGRNVSQVKGWRDARCVVRNKRYHPFLDNLGDGNRLVWSDRVVQAVRRLGLGGIRSHRIPVVEQITGNLIEGIQDYHAIEITGRIDLDRALYDGGDGLLCPECHSWEPRPGGTVSWGDKIKAIVDRGEDLPDFAMAGNIAIGGVFCKPVFADLVGTCGFSGFEFLSLAPSYRITPGQPGWWERYCAIIRERYPYNCDL